MILLFCVRQTGYDSFSFQVTPPTIMYVENTLVAAWRVAKNALDHL